MNKLKSTPTAIYFALLCIGTLVRSAAQKESEFDQRRKLSTPVDLHEPSLSFGETKSLMVEAGRYSSTYYISQYDIGSVIERGQSITIEVTGQGDIAMSQTTRQPVYTPDKDAYHHTWT